MRTTIAIDDDILAVAKHLAERDRKSLGAVISGLARQGMARGTQPEQTVRNGVPLLPTRAEAVPVTPELVRRLHDELP